MVRHGGGMTDSGRATGVEPVGRTDDAAHRRLAPAPGTQNLPPPAFRASGVCTAGPRLLG
jgi:hypothetical protein